MHRALVRVRLPRIFRLVLRNPRDSMCALALITAIAAIVANSLYLQPGRHPAPIFAIRPLPVLSGEETGTVTQSSRRRPPAPDAQKPELAQRSDPVPLPRPRAQSTPGPRPDAAEATNPSRQLGAVQRILNEFGYGPIRVSGILDDNTREGIARFERDHNLPVTGQNTPQLRRAISIATGRSLEEAANMRLKSGIWVLAYVRRCYVEGVFAVIRRRGADEAGAIFIKVNRLDDTADVYGPAPQSAFDAEFPVDRAFSPAMKTMPASDAEAEAYLVRQMRFDPDLWIIETEDRAGRHFLDRVVH